MWQIIPSLDSLVQGLAVAFTEPTFHTHKEIFLGRLMRVGRRTEYRAIQASTVASRVERHPFDRFYNFFSRSAWTINALAPQVCVAVVLALNPEGKLYRVVDDTPLHQRGPKVYGLGWFRDAVASTAKRVATASGNTRVVLGLAIPIPLKPDSILCLPLLARLHLPGAGSPTWVGLAAQMLVEILTWSPGRQVVLIGDGASAAKGRRGELDRRVTSVGRLRADADLYDPQPRPTDPRQAGSQAQERASAAQPSRGGAESRRCREPFGAVGLAGGGGAGLWRDPDAQDAGLSGGVARGIAPASDPDCGGARPGGEIPGCIAVYDGSGSRPVVGGGQLRPAVEY